MCHTQVLPQKHCWAISERGLQCSLVILIYLEMHTCIAYPMKRIKGKEVSSLDVRKWVICLEENCYIMCGKILATRFLLSHLGVVTKEPLGALAPVKVCAATVYVNQL